MNLVPENIFSEDGGIYSSSDAYSFSEPNALRYLKIVEKPLYVL